MVFMSVCVCVVCAFSRLLPAGARTAGGVAEFLRFIITHPPRKNNFVCKPTSILEIISTNISTIVSKHNKYFDNYFSCVFRYSYGHADGLWEHNIMRNSGWVLSSVSKSSFFAPLLDGPQGSTSCIGRLYLNFGPQVSVSCVEKVFTQDRVYVTKIRDSVWFVLEA